MSEDHKNIIIGVNKKAMERQPVPPKEVKAVKPYSIYTKRERWIIVSMAGIAATYRWSSVP